MWKCFIEIGYSEVIFLINKQVTIDIPCPGCGTKKTMPLGEAEMNPSYPCDQCGNIVHVDATKLFEGFQKVEADILAAFKKFK